MAAAVSNAFKKKGSSKAGQGDIPLCSKSRMSPYPFPCLAGSQEFDFEPEPEDFLPEMIDWDQHDLDRNIPVVEQQYRRPRSTDLESRSSKCRATAFPLYSTEKQCLVSTQRHCLGIEYPVATGEQWRVERTFGMQSSAMLPEFTKTQGPTVEQHAMTHDPRRIKWTKCVTEQTWQAIESRLYYPWPSAMNCPSCPFRKPGRAWKD
jgi:hypothetical protein